MTPKRFIELLEEAEYKPRKYSGRAMYGKQCVGIEVRPQETLSVGSQLALTMEYGSFGSGALEHLHEIMKSAREDAMGLDAIVYWPDIPWVDVNCISCDVCGESVHEDYIFIIPDERTVCQKCFEDYNKNPKGFDV